MLSPNSLRVIDKILIELDRSNQLPSKIIKHNEVFGFKKPYTGNQVIVTLSEVGFASIITEGIGSPRLHINLISRTLNIPQRIEIPLRLILKGLPDVEKKSMVYSHVLRMADGKNYVYYGITKRGWMKRFKEHMSCSLDKESSLLFHKTLREGICGRIDQLAKKQPTGKVLVENQHIIHTAGLDENGSLEIEEYLVGKYSFSKPLGLNMIPGGKAGISYLHRLKAIPDGTKTLHDEDRDRVIRKLINKNPRKGIPNPSISEMWNSSSYAEKVICGVDGRLSVEDVQLIREAALEGMSISEIRELVNAKNDQQVRNVLNGKTYKRIL